MGFALLIYRHSMCPISVAYFAFGKMKTLHLKVQRIHISNIVFTVLQNLMTFVEKYGLQVFDVRDILMPAFVF